MENHSCHMTARGILWSVTRMTSTPDVEPPCQASSSAFPKALPSGLAVLQVTAWPTQNSTACLRCLFHSVEGCSLIPSVRWGVLCCTASQTREGQSPGCSYLQQQELEVAFFIPSAREGGFTCRNYATRNRVFSCSLPLSVYKVLNTSQGGPGITPALHQALWHCQQLTMISLV